MTTISENTQAPQFTHVLLEKLREDCDDVRLREIVEVMTNTSEEAVLAGDVEIGTNILIAGYCTAIVADLLIKQAEAEERAGSSVGRARG